MQTRALSYVQWDVSLQQIADMHDAAWERLAQGMLDDVSIAEGFLNTISAKLKYDAFDLSHAQLRVLCQLSDTPVRSLLRMQVPYEIPKPKAER